MTLTRTDPEENEDEALAQSGEDLRRYIKATRLIVEQTEDDSPLSEITTKLENMIIEDDGMSHERLVALAALLLACNEAIMLLREEEEWDRFIGEIVKK